MPWYLFEGTLDGEPTRDRIAVRDEERAVQALERRGYADVRVLGSLQLESRDPTPQSPLESERTKKPGRWHLVLLWILMVAWIMVAICASLPTLVFWGVNILLAIAIAIASLRHGPSSKYGAILDAYVWARHAEVLRLANELQSGSKTSIGAMTMDIDFRAAAALWAFDRDEDAEALLETYRDDDDAKRSRIWWGRRAGSLAYARRDEESLVAFRRCLASDPENSTSMIDLAMTLVSQWGKLDEARELLSRVDARWLNPLAKAFLLLARGKLETEEHRYVDAVASLRSARRRLRWMPLTGLRPGVEADIHAWFCLALAALDREEARGELEQARPMLEATGDHELLGRCERALADRGIPYR